MQETVAAHINYYQTKCHTCDDEDNKRATTATPTIFLILHISLPTEKCRLLPPQLLTGSSAKAWGGAEETGRVIIRAQSRLLGADLKSSSIITCVVEECPPLPSLSLVGVKVQFLLFLY